MHVSLTAEKVFDLGPLTVTNALLTTWLVVTLIALFAVIFRIRLKKSPSGAQNVVELAIEGFHGLIESVTNNFKQTRKFFPVIFTIFVFVLLNNWAGLIPGVGSIGFFAEEPISEELTIPETPIAHELEEIIDTEFDSEHVVDLGEEAELAETIHTETNSAEVHTGEGADDFGHHAVFVPIFRAGSADLSFTLALAAVAVILVQIMGVAALGGWGYAKKFLNFSSPINFFVGILEIVSEISKMVSFSFRLFGNVFAGEVLLAVIIALVPFIVPMPFYGLEIFVGMIQALVFSVLTLVFFKMATAAH
ncbi:MAG: F0F1 ATP synthase subunit A [Candidatus Peribacteraceae bacterium]|nr:F0F1 ATP synthase subunit A [Candidatus Peribacteraceae bacterium]